MAGQGCGGRALGVGTAGLQAAPAWKRAWHSKGKRISARCAPSGATSRVVLSPSYGSRTLSRFARLQSLLATMVWQRPSLKTLDAVSGAWVCGALLGGSSAAFWGCNPGLQRRATPLALRCPSLGAGHAGRWWGLHPRRCSNRLDAAPGSPAGAGGARSARPPASLPHRAWADPASCGCASSPSHRGDTGTVPARAAASLRHF